MIFCVIFALSIIIVILVRDIRLFEVIAALFFADLDIVSISIFLFEWFPFLEAMGEECGFVCLPHERESDSPDSCRTSRIDYTDSMPSRLGDIRERTLLDICTNPYENLRFEIKQVNTFRPKTTLCKVKYFLKSNSLRVDSWIL